MLKLFRRDRHSSRQTGTNAQPLTTNDRQIERRRRIKGAMPRIVLDNKHMEGASLLPTRQALLRKLPENGVACEIGVSRGDFSEDILTINKPRRLHLVDAWDSERYASHLSEVTTKFAIQIQSGDVQIHQGLSTDVLPRFEDGYFDWVYIDTNHSYETTAAELSICQHKVKPGGRIAGHDFCTGNVITPVPYGVIEACNEFCFRENWRYEYLTLDPDGHFSFCLKKIT